ncbi:peptidoglycan DD-metalloendopeptidase family protein [Candidatus Nomurabacteria bacterium]|nr:peptidoglycan DD-metalloendopeptidase family protein [Candidatus Nomurabacteria bacterium]
MKLYPDLKKQFSALFLALSLGFYFFSLFAGVLPNTSFAETAQELKSKINEKDADIAKLEEEIRQYQSELDNIDDQKNSLSRSIKQLDVTRKKLVADINLTQKKIDKTSLTIESLSSDIGNKENSIANGIDFISLSIRNVNELEGESLVEAMLGKDDFTSVWNYIDNVATVREKILESVHQLKQVKSVLEDTRQETVDAKRELTALRSKLSDQEKIIIQNTNEKNRLLKLTKNSEANYQKLLRERIAQRDAFEKELLDYEAQLQFILDPSKLPSKGVLSWPLERIYVTQLFGKTVDSKRLYASGTHNGVDFRAAVGTPIMAMSNGTVMGTGDTDQTCPGASFGKFVFIRYTNGLSSTYGHLSLVKAKAGDVVKRGEVVGYSGNTGHTTGPHLHVSLYAADAVKMTTKPSVACGGRTYTLPVSAVNAYLDALYYLPPYKL